MIKRILFILLIIVYSIIMITCLINEIHKYIESNYNNNNKEVKKITKKEFFIKKFENELIVNTVILCSDNFDLSSELLFSIIENESKFDDKATNINKNGTIDKGLMQLNSNTFRNIDNKRLYDIEYNIINGSKLLKEMYDIFKNDIQSIAAYNCGQGNVKKNNISNLTFSYINNVLKYRNKLVLEYEQYKSRSIYESK